MAQACRSIFGALACLSLLLGAACASGEQPLATPAAPVEDDFPVTADATLLGGFASNQIGRDVPATDYRTMMRSQFRSLEYMPSGRPTSWRNPDSGNHGTFVSRAAYADSDGDICRPFTHMVTIDGSSRTLSGVACRDASGRWREDGEG